MNRIAVKLTPRRPALIASADTEFEVLLTVAAPDAPPAAAAAAPRAPLNLAIVIDRSGSMAGRPLKEAKRCARFIVEQLGSDDRAAIVAFDSVATLCTPSWSGGRQEALCSAIAGIQAGGSTALHDGWLLGAESIAPHANGQAVSRVLLLTDGMANSGLVDNAAIAADVARLAASGVGASTYGLGNGFDEALLAAMADAGGGQAYYGETAEDLMDPFREEFDLLRALCGRKLRLKLEPNNGVAVEVLNAYRADGQGRWIMPDLAYGGAGWALLRVRAPAGLPNVAGDVAHVLTAFVEYEDGGGRERASEMAHLRLGRVGADVYAAAAEDQTVLARLRELRAAELLQRAHEAAQLGQWPEIDVLLNAARAEAGDNAWVNESLSTLERFASQRDDARFRKEALYTARRQRTRLVSGDEESAAYSPDLERERASYLRRKPRQGKDLSGDQKS